MDLRELNLKLTKESLKKEIGRDILIIQTIHTIDELIKIVNTLVANLRERYGYYAPRASKIESQEKLLEQINKKIKEDIGLDFTKKDLDSITELASSTIQVLGAEKALFRHIKTGAKAPKFGIIFTHPNITKALSEERGKVARKISSEISKAAKID